MSSAFLARDIARWPYGFRWFICLIKRTSFALRLCCRLHEPILVRSHHNVVNPRFVDRLMIETPGLSSHGAPVDGAIAHNGEGSQPILMGLSMKEDGMGADDQQLSEISVSHF
jgi:hypothetical protein